MKAVVEEETQLKSAEDLPFKPGMPAQILIRTWEQSGATHGHGGVHMRETIKTHGRHVMEIFRVILLFYLIDYKLLESRTWRSF